MNKFYTKVTPKLLLLLCFLLLQASVFAQSNVRISITNPKITIKEALQEVERQSNMSVAYNESKLNGDKQIGLNLTNQSLENTLAQILTGTGYSYLYKDGYIMIVPDEKSEQSMDKPITGRIVDETGAPLVSASVLVQNTTIGSSANAVGEFTLLVAPGRTLVFSFLGYETQYVKVTSSNRYEVEMVPVSEDLSAVVVTALGIKRAQKALSYNVQEVKSDDFMTVRDVNLINSLSGKVAGVTINSSSSGVGGASKVVMRGTRAIDQSSNALYVIDGIPMYKTGGSGGKEFDSAGSTEAVADLNPEDIESMTVLTGAAAAALYGSDAANGAILITTKRGAAGYTTLTISQNTEFLNPFVMPNFQTRYGTGSTLSSVPVLDKSWGNRLNASNYMGYSPKKDYLKTGVIMTEGFTLSTGNEQNQTYISSSAVNSKGIVPNNDYDRYNFTIRNTTSFLKDKLVLDIGASYIKQKDRNMTNQGVYSNPLVTAYLFPRGDDWNDIKMYERYDMQERIYKQYWPQAIDEFNGQNPYWINYRNLRENDKDRYMLNANLSYQALDWLNIAGRARIDHTNTDFTERLFASSNTTLTEGSDNGLYGVRTFKDKQLYADLVVNINKTFGEDFSFQATAGFSLSDILQDRREIRGPLRGSNDIPSSLPNKFNLTQLDYANSKHKEEGWHDQSQSLFASAELGYKGAYYLTLTARNEWPSQLAGPHSKQSSFFYPSVGGSIILSEILRMPKQINYLKLRSSFASVGLPFARFLAQPTYEWDDINLQYVGRTHYPMPDLKPERTNSWEVGITTRLFRKFHLDFSFYNTKTFNQTFDPEISVSSKYSTMYLQTGSVRNRGIELSLGYDNRWDKFSWSSNFTLSANRNKILELVKDYKHPETGYIINIDRLDMGGLSQAHFILKTGGTLGDLYSLSDLQRDADGNVYVDPNGDIFTDNIVGDVKLGSIFPKCNMAWRNGFSWNKFSANFMLSARVGGIVYSSTQATLDLYGVSEASAKARDNGGVMVNGKDVISAEKWYTAIGAKNGIPQYYTYSATNIRLQEASLGYTFSKKQLWNICEMSVSVVGRNLWMIYNKAPFDPETIASTGNYYAGIDNFMMPSTRNIGFNVRFKF